MGLRQNSGMDRPAVIQTYGSVWIICVLVWIGGMDRPVGSGYGSGLYILTRSHIMFLMFSVRAAQKAHSGAQTPGGPRIRMDFESAKISCGSVKPVDHSLTDPPPGPSASKKNSDIWSLCHTPRTLFSEPPEGPPEYGSFGLSALLRWPR